MKASEIKELTADELKERIAEETTLLTKLRMNHVVSQLENPLQIRHRRRTVARLKTELAKRTQETK